GALVRCKQIAQNGVLLLAPTGKARVRLQRATDHEALTIAQFLYQLERYDGARQRPLFTGLRLTARKRPLLSTSAQCLQWTISMQSYKRWTWGTLRGSSWLVTQTNFHRSALAA